MLCHPSQEGIIKMQKLKFYYNHKQCTMVNAQWSIEEIPRLLTSVNPESYRDHSLFKVRSLKTKVHFVKFYYSRKQCTMVNA